MNSDKHGFREIQPGKIPAGIIRTFPAWLIAVILLMWPSGSRAQEELKFTVDTVDIGFHVVSDDSVDVYFKVFGVVNWKELHFDISLTDKSSGVVYPLVPKTKLKEFPGQGCKNFEGTCYCPEKNAGLTRIARNCAFRVLVSLAEDVAAIQEANSVAKVVPVKGKPAVLKNGEIMAEKAAADSLPKPADTALVPAAGKSGPKPSVNSKIMGPLELPKRILLSTAVPALPVIYSHKLPVHAYLALATAYGGLGYYAYTYRSFNDLVSQYKVAATRAEAITVSEQLGKVKSKLGWLPYIPAGAWAAGMLITLLDYSGAKSALKKAGNVSLLLDTDYRSGSPLFGIRISL